MKSFYILLATSVFNAIDCQVIEKCQWSAHTTIETSNSQPPTYAVNLDQPASERWKDIVAPRKEQILNFVNYIKEFVPSLFSYAVSTWLGMAVHKLPKPLDEEIIGIAKTLQMPIGDIMACNIFYELEKLCTSIITSDDQGNIYHGRNLDLGVFMGWDLKKNSWKVAELLKPLTINVDFVLNGKVLFKSVQFAGTVGIFTGVAPGKFSFSLNSRSSNELFAGPKSVITWLLSFEKKKFASLWARTVMEKAQSYQHAKEMLSTEPLLAPVYYILAGIKLNEGVIISRSNTESLNPVELSSTTWYLVQTNYDHWEIAPFYDDRRTPTILCLNEIAGNLKSNNGTAINQHSILYDVLSTIPIENKATIYTAIMNAKSGTVDSYLRNCPGTCYPW
ncbi:acid ceramidase isoform X1 [Hydra vulgaris]|uniref:acid ceramidase isoform X1 n=1 Tax=Hydra vulgaris TaxID=6087 RepID=UPI001F5F38BB|nr:acid ceramidase [Hydra vulgaris]